MPCPRGASTPLVLALALPAFGQGEREDVFPLAREPVYVALAAEAQEASPEIRAAAATIVAARARVPQVSALPDPELMVGYDYGGMGLQPGADEDTGLVLGFSQPLPGPGKRGLRSAVAEREVSAVEHALHRARLEVAYRLRRAYADLLLARENLALIDDQKRATRDIEELTRSRYAVGLAQQSDVLRAQAELARLERMRYHELGQEEIALAELNRVLARPAATPVAGTPLLRALDVKAVRVPSLAEAVAGLDDASPALLAAHAMVERSRASRDLASKEQAPDFVARTSYLYRGSLPPMATLDLGIVLPLYKGKKQKQALAEAEARLLESQSSAEAMRLRVRSSVEKARADLEAAVREAEAYATGVLAVDALAVESALASFQAGKAPFVAVLEAHNTLYRDRWEQAELLFHILWHSASLDAMGVVMD
ncbi:MAG TPA: TolC family protein [Vicinamibacteria bacterium]|nr:TolC family protein [Vicinamibacteria bacterium]